MFDGVCNLCNGIVSFIIRRDPAGKFAFATMQSSAGHQLIGRFYKGHANALDTFLLIRNGVCLVRSDAALAIAAELTFPWRLLAIVRIVPRPFRDLVYRLIANRRYRLFGKRDVCATPEPSVADRFID